MLLRWKSASLRSQLVAIIMGLLLLALAATGAGTLTLVKSYLQGQVDDKLKAAVALAQDQQSFDKLAQPNPSTPTDTAVPTDYSLTLYVPGLEPYPFGGSQSDRPAIANITAAEAKLRGNSPFQVKGTAGTNWRVVAIGVTANGQNGVVIIGLPLTPVDKVMEHAVLVVVGVGLLTLVLAFFIATWTVARSFRPLAKVEKTAAAIAAGDLSRRVEVDNPHTEVGRLGGSLNAMLAHIEASFAARAASEGRMRRFAADASHELRTPLVTIRGFSELYRHGALATKEDVAMAMGRIESEAKRMGSMVEDLLMLARLDEQRPLQLKPVDLQLLAHDAVVDTKASSGDRTIRLTGLDDASPTAAPVQGDEAKLRQVIGNLVGNALRYTPEGSPIELAVGVRNTPSGSVSVIEIRDHGPGIPETETNKIFERFYRADTSRTRETGGSGLGLAIVAAIVGSHGGTVQVAETDGGGATLVVSLPFHQESAELLST
ncbi:HAMP domain-containing histidine kinase [Paenarthrobacter sp. MSM-2-10-13]|uniref:sensor histidine kinase n=1 Tax=Micrococcaceae TaxID=1268 RepID=UPI0014248698|nr:MULTISPECIES: HAMP domain-containing sensor histidine kinase [Micrococcaceae]MCM0617392.1 HAMP domain-containing histidine kinase [Paenarthrobacter sp. TYUT067]NHW47257.1 HAMP domain-containing histidine kinase [Paenarthrobacter sp. MSM-2-10-13]BCW62048.1 two-component sensor histidine kinase [Arthrobacter sp. StoSoilB22]